MIIDVNNSELSRAAASDDFRSFRSSDCHFSKFNRGMSQIITMTFRFSYPASRLVDGKYAKSKGTDGFKEEECAHTAGGSSGWFILDLKHVYSVMLARKTWARAACWQHCGK
jgi:hypothetical protein